MPADKWWRRRQKFQAFNEDKCHCFVSPCGCILWLLRFFALALGLRFACLSGFSLSSLYPCGCSCSWFLFCIGSPSLLHCWWECRFWDRSFIHLSKLYIFITFTQKKKKMSLKSFSMKAFQMHLWCAFIVLTLIVCSYLLCRIFCCSS